MHRSWITRGCPALLVAVVGACATPGSTTNVTSTGNVVRDSTAAAARRDTSSMTTRDTTVMPDTTTRRDTTTAMPTTPTPPTSAGVQLSVAEAPGAGAYVTDASGRAVYVVENDSTAFSCSGACATDLDPVIGTATIATGATGLDASLLNTRPLPDGRMQVTYEGKPLYFARADMGRGDTKGQGMKSYGNVRLLTPKK